MSTSTRAAQDAVKPAFDAAAPTYDTTFTETRLGRRLRAAVWSHLATEFSAGDRVLELGCGTGVDAVWLAQRGIHVTATDQSTAMLAVARRKARNAGADTTVEFAHLDLDEISSGKSLFPDPHFDGAFSNFGALNCLPDRRPLARALAQQVRPGGRIVLVMMGPICPWEIVWHAAHGELRPALRRFRAGSEAHVGGGARVQVWYPSPRRLRSEFAPYFRHVRTVGIGVLLPPSYLGHLVERWPRLFDTVAALERRLAGTFPWTWLNDHYLIVFERRDDIRQDGRRTLGDTRVLDRPLSPGRSTKNGRPKGAAFTFVCPRCRTPLQIASPDERICPRDGGVYRRVNGIWRFLLPERRSYFEQFMAEYETVRQAEGRGAEEPAYYRALPFHDRTGRFDDEWRIRATSFVTLLDRVLSPLEARHHRPLQVLDLGAGNGWLAHRLVQRGHQIAAVDLLTNTFDGLGAHVHYALAFTPVQTEYDRLPFPDAAVDLAVFNGSLHYSTEYETTLQEVLRVLRPDGRLVIMDSPVYHDAASGEQMVAEREACFEEVYGFRSNAIPCESYLTYDRLDQLAEDLHVDWQIVQPFYGWRRTLRPWKARILGRREPAGFPVIVGWKRNG